MPKRRDPASLLQSKDPRLQKAWASVAQHNPDAVEGVSTIRPMNWLERNSFPSDAQAQTWPWGTIAYRPENLDSYPEAMFEHELEHVRQNQSTNNILQRFMDVIGSSFQPYNEREDEKEAFRREQLAYEGASKGDVRLKSGK